MKMFDPYSHEELTFRDCLGGREVINERGERLFIIYQEPEYEPLDELFMAAMPVVNGNAQLPNGEVGYVQNFVFRK